MSMKIYTGHIEIAGRTVFLPRPMTLLELSHYRFGPMLLPLAIGTMAAGQVMQGFAAKRQGENEAAIAKYDQAVTNREVEQIELTNRFRSIQQAQESERIGNEILVNVNALGSVPTQGAGLLARATQSVQSELDNLLIGYEGRIEASRARSQAAGYGIEATAAKQRGRAGFAAGMIGAAGTTLLGAYAIRKPPGQFPAGYGRAGTGIDRARP